MLRIRGRIIYHFYIQFDSDYLTNLLTGVQKSSNYTKFDFIQFMINAFEGSWLSRSDKDMYLDSLHYYAISHNVREK